MLLRAVRKLSADARGDEFDDQNKHHQAPDERADHTPAAGVETLRQRRADTARADDAERRGVFEVDVKAVDGSGNEARGELRDNAVADLLEGGAFDYDNIKKAIDKATGNLDDVVYESIQYEGYGPGGIAVMVECLTDNRNRTASTVRANFSKHGGNLGTNGSVSYLFKRKGVITFEKGNIDEDTAMMTALDAGADDFDATEDGYEIYTTPDVFLAVKDAISSLGVEDFTTCEITFVPDNYVSLDDETKEKAERLIEALEDNDDVQEVYHNLED